MPLVLRGPATCSPPETRDHPFRRVPEEAVERVHAAWKASGGAGVYVVTTRTKTGKARHCIVAVCADGSVATHGGCYGENAVARAKGFAQTHSRRYGLPVNLDLYEV